MSFYHRINRILDMPPEIYTKLPKLETVGFNELIFENYVAIIEYEENFVKLKTDIGNINIDGENLNLDKMTEEILKITGKIISISIERI